jgi:hypothetical protein
VRFGIELRDDGYNIFALGPVGVGRRFLVKHLLRETSGKRPTPPDLCYVNPAGNGSCAARYGNWTGRWLRWPSARSSTT